MTSYKMPFTYFCHIDCIIFYGKGEKVQVELETNTHKNKNYFFATKTIYKYLSISKYYLIID